MCRVDVEENTGDDNCLFLQEFFEEGLQCLIYKYRFTPSRTRSKTYQAIVQRSRQLVKVKPDIERACRWNVNPEAHALQTLEDMVTLRLEVFL